MNTTTHRLGLNQPATYQIKVEGRLSERWAEYFDGLILTIEHEPDPMFADIEFEFDLDGRRGRFLVKDVLGAEVEPIKNPVTGADHFIAIHPHEGFEFREAEMASADLWSKGELELSHSGRFAAISYVSYGPYGIIPEESLPNRRG